MTDFYTRKDIDNTTVEFTVTVPQDEFKKEYSALLKKNLEDTDIKGFRKGKVPTDFVEPQIGNSLKIQAFEKLVPMLITTALQKENLEPIAPPEYKEFPDFKQEKELTFTMNITIMPEFKLGNLKKIKITKEEVKVEEKEIDEALENIKKNQETKEKELNEKWAKEIIDLLKLENDVKDLKGLRDHIREAMQRQKEHMVRHKLEDQALQEAIKISNITIPEQAIQFEAEERERAFTTDMQQKGINIDDFLKANNITLEKMRELWIKDAKQALEADAFLRTYIKERDIKVTDEDLKTKIEQIKTTAPKETDQSIFENEEWKEYIRRIEQKEVAFQSFIKEVLGE
jgi:FKBP-type peptidyl-prolyl cis-trans isomerase (trigger factor)